MIAGSTPMNGILGMTDLVLETDLTRDQRESVALIKSSADALMTVINDILDFSTIESGRLELRSELFEPRELIDEVMDTLAEVARRKGLEFASLVPVTVPERLVGSMSHLRQVLINLTGNAIKYTDSGSVMVRVRYGAVSVSSMARSMAARSSADMPRQRPRCG